MSKGLRWLTYLVERFALPVFLPSAILHTLFLFGYSAPYLIRTDTGLVAVGVLTYLGVFLILRLSDELKDKSHDDQYYPNRPVQRGLLALIDIKHGLVVAIVATVLLNISTGVWLALAVLAVVAGYMTLMRYEFFMPKFLRPRILLYMVTHQLFVPLFFSYYFVVAGRWPSSGADWWFLVANLMIVMALEIARKIRPRDLENSSRDTYSAALGRGRACMFLLVLVGAVNVVLVQLGSIPVVTLWLLLVPAGGVLIYYVHDRRWTAHGVLATVTLTVTTWMIWSL